MGWVRVGNPSRKISAPIRHQHSATWQIPHNIKLAFKNGFVTKASQVPPASPALYSYLLQLLTDDQKSLTGGKACTDSDAEITSRFLFLGEYPKV